MQNRHSINTTVYSPNHAGFCYDIDAPPSANPNNRINTPKGIFTVSDDRGNAVFGGKNRLVITTDAKQPSTR